MTAMRLSLLGGFAALTAAGEPLGLPTRKTEALLAYLALSGGRAVPRDRLVALLWSDRGAEQARSSLRQALTALRQALADESVLSADRAAVTLRADAVETDVHAFERLSVATAPGSLRQAVELYRGELLAGIALQDPGFLAWREAEAARLHSLAIAALLKLLPRTVADAASAESAADARRLLDLDPLQEPAHQLLMRHYAAQGQRSLVLEQYESCRDRLQAALGARPSAETERLRAQLLGEASAAPASTPAAAAPGPKPADEQAHIVVVDDEAGLRATLRDFLAKRGFAVTTAEGGAALRRIMAEQPADLVLLDINMPGEDGLSLARYLRRETKAAIIMLTAADEVVDRVVGLEVGADDYVAKPFDLRELLARIRSVLRRTNATAG